MYLRNVLKRTSSEAVDGEGKIIVEHPGLDADANAIQEISQLGVEDIPIGKIEEIPDHGDSPSVDSTITQDAISVVGQPNTTRIKVPLTFDSEFFGLLEHGICGVDYLQEQEQSQMSKEVLDIGKIISRVAAPSSSSTDIARWRAIFEIYIQASIFFSSTEQDHGIRSAEVATKQLQWFSEEASKRDLEKHFKSKESHAALDQFVRLNVRLLRNLKFQEINQTAMLKILKSMSSGLDTVECVLKMVPEFDKRTALGVKTTFPEFVAGRPFLARTIAKAICFQLSQEVLSTVPQLNDYLCPVCFAIAYKPIRLRCGHIFCIRCMIVMQRARDSHCPLCRGNVVMEADSGKLF